MGKPSILFYHAHFFGPSETFIYHQARNPHINTLLLGKRITNENQFNFEGFKKFIFKRSIWDGILSNIIYIFGIDRYYFSHSVSLIEKLLAGEKIDLIHAQFGFSAVRILPVAKRMKLPLVVSFHGLDASKLLRKRPYRNGLKKVFDYASSIIVCNPSMADVLPLDASQRQKVKWVPYGIDLEKFTPAKAVKPTSNSVQLLHVGRLIEKKGVPDLIRVFLNLLKSHDNILLNIVGTGPEEELCRSIVKSAGAENQVLFHGWKTPDQVKELMELCDIFVLNSRTARDGDMEGLPNGILEAMAMGMAVVSTRHAGIPRAVESEKEGILVGENDNEGLTIAISRLLENSELRLQLGNAARQKVEKHFTLEQMHDALSKIYRPLGG
jgi:glycosyltransferase involved in cell wall biosynthesis